MTTHAPLVAHPRSRQHRNSPSVAALLALLSLPASFGLACSSEADSDPASTVGGAAGAAGASTSAATAGAGGSSAGATAAGAGGGTASQPLALPAPPDVAAIPADAEVTASGLGSRVLTPGTGTRRPGPRSRVRVEYSGWQTNGVLFDSSRLRGMPAEFALDRVIEGWTEGLQLMVEGETRRLWIPEDLAYPGGEPSGMLVFDVELLAIVP